MTNEIWCVYVFVGPDEEIGTNEGRLATKNALRTMFRGLFWLGGLSYALRRVGESESSLDGENP
jgi:hypothetical protein